ncbi:class A beta-lactamase [Kocuria massiliensis]|uniref:class A beta-lactamase n=1 Tax=Kocuria massiliensis TaxID=1926282 RepID=UPI001301FA70|nr:class A beta-lactamase [Kocuria massiliensis]
MTSSPRRQHLPGRSTSRRSLLAGATALIPLAYAGTTSASAYNPTENSHRLDAAQKLRDLETRLDGRIGVHAINTGTQVRFGYRSTERFLFCSVGKVLAVSAILHRAASDSTLLTRHIPIAADDILAYAPVTSQHVGGSMSVEDLCHAAITVSDNTAANLLVEVCGGPSAVTEFVRGAGDVVTRVDRTEPTLNDADADLDTTTPSAFCTTLGNLALESVLTPEHRLRLTTWLKANTTGADQIRAGVPDGVTVGDKTGAGSHGESNDVAVLWPTKGSPVILSIFTVSSHTQDTALQKEAIAEATRIVTPIVLG